MKKELKKKVKESAKVIEIHIFVHSVPSSGTGGNYTYPPNPITNPPYYVTC